jgi:hypothetical protein
LRKATNLIADKQLDLALEHVGELLSRMSDLVVRVAAAGLEREEVGLELMPLASPEELIQHAPAPPHTGRARCGRTQNLDGLFGPIRTIRLREEVRELKPEMLGNLLETSKRDAALAVLQR